MSAAQEGTFLAIPSALHCERSPGTLLHALRATPHLFFLFLTCRELLGLTGAEEADYKEDIPSGGTKTAFRAGFPQRESSLLCSSTLFTAKPGKSTCLLQALAQKERGLLGPLHCIAGFSCSSFLKSIHSTMQNVQGGQGTQLSPLSILTSKQIHSVTRGKRLLSTGTTPL